MPRNVLSSPVATHHHVELFTTAARLSGDGAHWIVPVHAWIYTPQHSRVRKAALAAILKARLGIEATAATEANFDRRANLLFADNHRRRRLRVVIAGGVHELPPTSPNGHARAEFQIPVGDVRSHGADGGLRVRLLLPDDDPRAIEGCALLVPPNGVSVISDIDDTVKVSHVTDRARLMDATLFRDFEAVPGMGAVYTGWARRGVSIHFVSSSPWHLYAPLLEMLDAAGFPRATLDLKHIRLKDTTILDLFKDATKTKPPLIERLLAEFPARRFVLVGDSGERDPEIYAGLARAHPGRIVQILIRDVTGATADDPRYRKVFAGWPSDRWQIFNDPGEISWRPSLSVI